jgi:hypothetical protein
LDHTLARDPSLFEFTAVDAVDNVVPALTAILVLDRSGRHVSCVHSDMQHAFRNAVVVYGEAPIPLISFLQLFHGPEMDTVIYTCLGHCSKLVIYSDVTVPMKHVSQRIVDRATAIGLPVERRTTCGMRRSVSGVDVAPTLVA